jgi:rhodanese-related sulfurtransferase
MRISCAEAKKLIAEQNAQFVDVRTPEEFSASALPGAVNIPLQDLDRMAEAQLENNRPIVLYCRSGARSNMAMQMLESMGFEDVYDLGGFMSYFDC